MQYRSGRPFPLGSHLCVQAGQKGVNFAIVAPKATAVELCLFAEAQGAETRLPMVKSEDVWHLFVENLSAGVRYGFRVQGEVNEPQGDLFNPQKLLLDPYAKAIVGDVDLSSDEACQWFYWNDLRDNAAVAPKSVVVHSDIDWQKDENPLTPWAETVIYEAHVKGFSKRNPNVPAELAGTFLGMAHPASINHFKRLGVTAVELLPITFHIDERHLQLQGLHNYWGYNVLGHFAVDQKLASRPENALNEFKTLVKTLHANGIEVIMDVVFNHTAEGEKDGAMLCQRGIDNAAYYWLNGDGNYENWTGCGNTLNLSNPTTLRWVIDCLCYWAEECHVDGFRFDLASILGRTPDFSDKAAFFTAIHSNARLAHVKLIAEPWDIGWGGYQLGRFPARFAEWNDRFRDDMRRFWLHESGDLSGFARRFAGSDDIFPASKAFAKNIHFLTAHDGFTLHDLASYQHKHNEANGEQNRDGHSENFSNNYGMEGETDNVEILAQRNAACRSLLAMLLLSGGTPMLLGGDELGNSQQGNNNAYCQDNETTWLDWQNADQDLIDYVANLIAIRKQIPLLSSYNRRWTEHDVRWLTPESQPMQVADWHNPNTKAIQILLENQWLILINGKQTDQTFSLPESNWKTLSSTEPLFLTDTTAVTLSRMGVCVLQKASHIS